ncbi:F5/8 type C domain protein [uncultured archaeon]|nr:F5/8 type C domain protein [uncultured archaeon]
MDAARVKRAQGASEYLVIFAIVLIVAVLAIALLSSSAGGASDAALAESQVYWRSAYPISIVETGSAYMVPNASPGGASVIYLKLKNRGAYPIRLANVSATSNLSTLTGNLALGKPATNSSRESSSYPASYAVDGITTTRWSSQYSDPQWIYVDLGAIYNISRVVLNWRSAYACGKNYTIQLSNDASAWSTVYSRTDGTGGTETLDFTASSGRYVRMYGAARCDTGYTYSLREFEVYGSIAAPTYAIDATIYPGEETCLGYNQSPGGGMGPCPENNVYYYSPSDNSSYAGPRATTPCIADGTGTLTLTNLRFDYVETIGSITRTKTQVGDKPLISRCAGIIP